MTLKVRTSERRDFKRCRKRWEYGYVEGLIPKGRNSKLWVGDYVHQVLALYYAGNEESAREFMGRYEFMQRAELGYNQMDEEERQRLNADISLAQGMLDHYLRWAPDNDAFTVHQTELYGEVVVGRDILITVKADSVIEDDKGYWLLEHKTSSGIDSDSVWLELDDQATTYTWAFQQPTLKILRGDELVPNPFPSIKGMIYNFLLKQVPHEPIMTQKGLPSRGSENLTCTADAYLDTLTGVFPDPSAVPQEYTDFLKRLEAKKWFHRLPVYRGRDELAGFEELLLAEIAEMERARAKPSVRYRNPTRDCSWDCAFFEVCKGELEGLDMDFTKSEKFDREEQLPLIEISD